MPQPLDPLERDILFRVHQDKQHLQSEPVPDTLVAHFDFPAERIGEKVGLEKSLAELQSQKSRKAARPVIYLANISTA